MTSPISFQDVCQSFEANRAQIEEGVPLPYQRVASLPELYKILSAYVIEQGKVNAEHLAPLQSLTKKYIRSQELLIEFEQTHSFPKEGSIRELEETIDLIKTQAVQPDVFSISGWTLSLASSDELNKVEEDLKANSEPAELQKILPLLNAARQAQGVFNELSQAAYDKDQPTFDAKLSELLSIHSKGANLEHRILDALNKDLEVNIQQAKNQKLAASYF